MRKSARNILLVMLLSAAVIVAAVWIWAQFYFAIYNGGRVKVFVIVSRQSVAVEGESWMLWKPGLHVVHQPNDEGFRPRFWPAVGHINRGVGVELPFWFILFMLGITAAIVWRMRPTIKLLHCTQCEYNLAGNASGVCPECGNAIGASQ